jgi:hypothetical protein
MLAARNASPIPSSVDGEGRAAELTAWLSGRTQEAVVTTSRDISRAQAVLTRSPGLAEALCITAVKADTDDAVTRYGGFELDDPLTLEEALHLETLAYPRRLELAVAVARPPWTFMVEPSETQGTRPETLRQLSDGTTAVNVFWNINLRTRCRYWETQLERASFELLDDEPHRLADPRLERFRQELTFDDADRFKGEALVLLERITGVRVDWMTERHTAAVVVASISSPPPIRCGCCPATHLTSTTRTPPTSNHSPPAPSTPHAASSGSTNTRSSNSLRPCSPAPGNCWDNARSRSSAPCARRTWRRTCRRTTNFAKPAPSRPSVPDSLTTSLNGPPVRSCTQSKQYPTDGHD